jgi:hypothetical protein
MDLSAAIAAATRWSPLSPTGFPVARTWPKPDEDIGLHPL